MLAPNMSAEHREKQSMRREQDSTTEWHQQNLPDLLAEHGATWQMNLTPAKRPRLEIILPNPASTDEAPSLSCSDCNKVMQPVIEPADHLFAQSGVIVRFTNVLTYACELCAVDSDPTDKLQAEIIGRTLHLVREHLTAQCVSMKPPSKLAVKMALGLL